MKKQNKIQHNESITDKIIALIDVKSIITVVLTATFGYLTIVGTIKPEQFITIFTTVVNFYFWNQFRKKRAEDDEDGDEE